MSSKITDPEVLAFIARTEAFSPPGSNTASASEQRRLYDRMCASFRKPRPTGIAVEAGAFAGRGGMVPIRRYWPRDPGPARVLYFHGGGFVVGGLDSHDDVCAEIAARAQVEVIAVDYRLAPEHRHPAAFDDCLAASLAFGERPLVLVGDSAGGNLAAALALHSTVELCGQVLIYPGLGGEALDLASYRERANPPLLSAEDIAFYREIRSANPDDAQQTSFSPLLASDFSKAPPCFVSAAEFDPLRDDGLAYVDKLAQAGIAGEAVIEDQLPHGHLRARRMSARAGAAFDRICEAVHRFASQA